MIPIARQLNRSSSHKFSGLEIFALYFNLFVYENQVNYEKIVKRLIINIYLLTYCAKEEIVISEKRREYMEYPTGNHVFVLNQPTGEWMKPLFNWIKTI